MEHVRHGRTWKRPDVVVVSNSRKAENQNDKRRDKRQERLDARIAQWDGQDGEYRGKEYTKPGSLK